MPALPLLARFHLNTGNPVSQLLWLTTVGLLVASSVFNVLLSMKTRELRSVIATLKAEGLLTPGTRVPSIVGEDLNGQAATIQFSDSQKPTLIYVFTPTCGWCRRNESNLKALVTQGSGRFRIVGLSLAALRLDDSMNNIPGLPIYTNLDRSTTTAYKFSGTPETILVSPEGTVLKIWKGAYMGETLQEIERFFEVRLPGLTEAK